MREGLRIWYAGRRRGPSSFTSTARQRLGLVGVLPTAMVIVCCLWGLPGATQALSGKATALPHVHPPQAFAKDGPRNAPRVTILAEAVWRKAASDHQRDIHNLLGPGLVGLDHPLMRPVLKQFRGKTDGHGDGDGDSLMTMLDPKHPIYNFLVEYYGLKGLKGPKRLARWSPGIGLFFWEGDGISDNDHGNDDDPDPEAPRVRRIDSLQDYHEASRAVFDSELTTTDTAANPSGRDEADRRIFLEGGTPEDFGLTLYLQGAEWIPAEPEGPQQSMYGGKQGILYRPIRYSDNHHHQEDVESNQDEDDAVVAQLAMHHRKATSFVWYRSILEGTLRNDPVLHCYGLHEWAMQYHPPGAPPPPSGKYQAHLPLRVARETINQTVERKGLRCTHVDALRFFAPAAGPLNHHGASLERGEQLELEQPGCVHAHMDLLKIALRIKPYCDPTVLVQVLEIALRARALDVGASPYDCSAYRSGVDAPELGETVPIRVIPVETTEGRALYKSLQTQLLAEAQVVRTRLLQNYEAYGTLAFSTDQLDRARTDPTDERFATAEPGGKAWRHNLLDRPPTTQNQPQS